MPPPSSSSRPPANGRRTAGVRTGGRSERIVGAVLAATMVELAASGYGRLRVEDVAADGPRVGQLVLLADALGERVDDATIARLVDLAIRGVEGGGGRRI